MTFADIFQETHEALSSNKARSSLTILGIVIGISSVIAMVSIGQGAQGDIQASIQSIGSNLVQITPGAPRGVGQQVSQGRGSARTLTAGDAEAIATLPLAQAVAAELSSRYQVTTAGKNTNTQVVGTVPAYPSVRNVSVAEGSFISDQHLRTLAKVAVLGPTVRDDLFGPDNDPVGQAIRINKTEFRVIGVTAVKGGTGFGSHDDMIFIPLTTAQKFLAGADYVTTISVQAKTTDDMPLLQEEITSLLLERHKISDPAQADFSTLNQADIVATASSVTETFTLLLAAVAGISLLVGGIGIMNMMLTTVTERTREIGLRKAIGARRADINTQFLAESVALTCIGGLLGVCLGLAVAWGVSKLGLLQTQVSWNSVMLAFAVSAGIGIVFGYYPARRASRMNPITALRYE